MQVALAVTLLFGAGLLMRSFQEMGRVSPGFDPKKVLAFQISMSWSETTNYAAMTARAKRIPETLESIPGVVAATSAVTLPGIPTTYQLMLLRQGLQVALVGSAAGLALAAALTPLLKAR